jgi:hypothetical protein
MQKLLMSRRAMLNGLGYCAVAPVSSAGSEIPGEQNIWIDIERLANADVYRISVYVRSQFPAWTCESINLYQDVASEEEIACGIRHFRNYALGEAVLTVNSPRLLVAIAAMTNRIRYLTTRQLSVASRHAV